MITRIFNLILASGMTFLTFNISGHWNVTDYILAVMTPCWLVSALGLFFKNRLAWYVSLVCASIMFCGSLAMFFASLIQEQSENTGYFFIFGFAAFVLSLADAAGLIHLRRKFITETSKDANI